MKILFSGGGTMGSVSPLIAVYEKIKKDNPQTEFLFIGSESGPEKKAVESYKIPFKKISSGKLRRYFSWDNFVDPFKIIWGFFQVILIIIKFKPNVVMIAGSFIGVPVAWAAYLLRVPVLIHQQDIIAGLANKMMANFSKKITISYEPSLNDFSSAKTILTGNPVREEFYVCHPKKGRDVFGLKEDLPVLLILGGGTGSQVLNELVEKSLNDLLQFCQIIHITGRDKKINLQAENYHQFEFLTHEMTDAICAADLVVTRAGMSTLSELVILAKSTIIIPLPESHQEYNAAYFQKNNAAIVLSQPSLNSETLISAVRELFFEKYKKDNLSRNISKIMDFYGAQKVAKELLALAKK
ncbi:MAG: UDP-N-acetylglucosamine--N-acetylmuramyl-(pentapeptide) pyrophosphoryl-undecaprenol N-acetylglucosamine transferase [Candidatus Buchananbacteria bacterium]|nr:UDP-N-acetylglucosamine--N-acetylmuramyl-(pentapeptide) pyrophosphoryl-undecaprenol N-acetylglucosamine transferase [Candidatus Buchananbacteria bacterium]